MKIRIHFLSQIFTCSIPYLNGLMQFFYHVSELHVPYLFWWQNIITCVLLFIVNFHHIPPSNVWCLIQNQKNSPSVKIQLQGNCRHFLMLGSSSVHSSLILLFPILSRRPNLYTTINSQSHYHETAGPICKTTNEILQ